jgi:hypothetical protein
MTCPTCDGNQGWGHYSTEPDHFGRLARVSGSDKFFTCDTCKGTGEVTATALRQSLIADEERQRVFDDEMAQMQTEWEQELRREEREKSRYYN